jgi:GNAT superfamily N-acetyltransferase
MRDFSIRRAGPQDCGIILALLRELADYEKLLDRFVVGEADIARDMVGDGAVCPCALVFADGQPAGIATWFWTYKTFRACRSLYLEDLFVRPAFRGQGLGRRLLAWLAALAADQGAAAMEWQVLDWNTPSIDFYRGLGARPVEEWINYRIEGGALAALAADA